MASAPSNRHGGGCERLCYVLFFFLTLFVRPARLQSTSEDPNVISRRALEAPSLGCFWTECGNSTCPSDTTSLVSATVFLRFGSPPCFNNQQKTLCCPSPLAIDKSTCSWRQGRSLRGVCVGKCPSGQIAVANDVDNNCILGFSTYCCDPPKDDKAANQEGANEFGTVVHQFMTGSTCSVDPPLDKRQANGDISTITTLYMASRLAPLLWAYAFDTSELQYVTPYQKVWDQERTLTGSGLPSWDSLAFTISKVSLNPDLVGVVAGQLCTAITGAKVDPIICSPETCSDNFACPLQGRMMGKVPSDVTPQDYDTTAVKAGPDFTEPGTFAAGPVAWWMQAKNLAWWLGSNHGVDSSTRGAVSSSVFVDFNQAPSDNLFTGAGPIWGCTTVSLVSNLGAWTGHFWQGFFMDETLFVDQVLNFLVDGNPAENYPGLANLVAPGGPFDRARTQFLSVVIMTPQNYTVELSTTWEAPQIHTFDGPLYPVQIARIQAQLLGLPGLTGIPISTFLYAPDPLIWKWTAKLVSQIVQWTWKRSRSPRLTNAPWTGMLTIQRRATNSPGLKPAVRIYVENNLILNQEYN